MSTFVSCVCWVPKSASKETPIQKQLTKEEVDELVKEKEQLHQFESVTPPSSGPTGADSLPNDASAIDDDVINELYELNDYDSEDDDKGEKMSGAGMGNSLAGLTYYASNVEDPYITLKNVQPDDEDEDDFKVLPTDNLLVVGKAEEDYSSIEVHVYSESDDHSYSHHEILLPSFPLSLEWMNYDSKQPTKEGNFIAVGMMSPGIEVWDLDVVDALEPVLTIGTHILPRKAAGSRKKKKSKAEPVSGHLDAVMSLSWNKTVRNILASASADCSVKVWDMSGCRCVLTLQHSDKVQSVVWHPYEPELIATGSCDGEVRSYNCKSPEKPLQRWKIDGEVEKALWNHFKPHQLLICSSDKTVWCFNKEDTSVIFKIHAHSEAITDMSFSCYMPGLLVTASADDTLKFWDILDDKPTFLLSREVHKGSVMCAKFNVDSPFTLAVGGQKNGFHILNLAPLEDVMQRFKGRDLMAPVTSSGDLAVKSLQGEGARDVSMEVDQLPPASLASKPRKAHKGHRK